MNLSTLISIPIDGLRTWHDVPFARRRKRTLRCPARSRTLGERSGQVKTGFPERRACAGRRVGLECRKLCSVSSFDVGPILILIGAMLTLGVAIASRGRALGRLGRVL